METWALSVIPAKRIGTPPRCPARPDRGLIASGTERPIGPVYQKALRHVTHVGHFIPPPRSSPQGGDNWHITSRILRARMDYFYPPPRFLTDYGYYMIVHYRDDLELRATHDLH